MPEPMRYDVWTWDVDTQAWEVEARDLDLWGLRPWIRRLRSRGYSEASVLIERGDGG